MPTRILCIFVLSLLQMKSSATIFDRIIGQKVAVTLGKVSLHTDTALHTQTNIVLNDGEVLDVIGSSKTLHFDKDENQKFKWYRVRTSKKQEGWVFGDAIALATPKKELDPFLLPFFQQKTSFSIGFEEAIVWFASVEGLEIKGNQYLNNPLYLENYLVITNAYGKSVSLYLSGRGIEGEQILKSLVFQDINDDTIKEIILEKSAFNQGSFIDNRTVEAYAFTTAGLNKVFDESLSLKEDDNLPSPALYKVVEIDNQLIRVSYVDFMDCQNYKQSSLPNAISKTLERCVEYVTYTYGWDIPTAQFKLLYNESRLPLISFSKSNYFLYESPSEKAKKTARVLPNAELTIIQTYNEYQQKGDTKTLNVWLYVEDKFGKKGYIPAYQIYLGDSEHAVVLHEYFNNTPAYLGDWKSDEQFLFINDGIKKNEEE